MKAADLSLLRRSYRRYLKSEHWQKMRQDRLTFDDFRCVLCNSGVGLNVHHRDYSRLGFEKLNDVLTLCELCHMTFHKEFEAWEGLRHNLEELKDRFKGHPILEFDGRQITRDVFFGPMTEKEFYRCEILRRCTERRRAKVAHQ